jgi:hypothetical protein
MSVSDTEDSESSYADVKLAANPKSGSYFFIDTASFSSLVTTFMGLAAFLALHGFSSLRAPPTLATKSEVYNMNETNGNTSIDIDITLAQLIDRHRFVGINASLVTSETTTDRAVPIDCTVRGTLRRASSVVRSEPEKRLKSEIAFTKGTNRSSIFPVSHFVIQGIDTIDLRLTLESEFHHIVGSEFYWSFANPSADKYHWAMKLLFSCLVAYMLVFFVFYLKLDSESFTQVYLIILGFTGVFSSNPLTYFIPSLPGPSIADHILMALFTATYKMFLILELEMLRSHSAAPRQFVVAILAVLFAVYATVDAAAGYDRQAHITNSEIEVPIRLETEITRSILHGIFAAIALIYLLAAVLRNDGVNARRVFFFGFSVVATVLMSLITDVGFLYANIWMYSIRPLLLSNSLTVTLTSLTLFLLHTGGGPEYVGIDKAEGQDNHTMEIDQLSDGQKPDNDDDLEEDDE